MAAHSGVLRPGYGNRCEQVTEEAKHLDDGAVRRTFSFATMELKVVRHSSCSLVSRAPEASPYGQLDGRIADWSAWPFEHK